MVKEFLEINLYILYRISLFGIVALAVVEAQRVNFGSSSSSSSNSPDVRERLGLLAGILSKFNFVAVLQFYI